MFTEVVEQLLPDLADHDVHDLVSGSFHPADDTPSNRARDREFELFIGAICRRSGLRVELREPDTRFALDGVTYSVAAKRIASPKRVEQHVRKAAQQIADQGYPGFIVLDITRILDASGDIVLHWRQAHQTVGGSFLAFVNSEHPRTLQRKWNDLVRGVVLRAVFPLVSEGFRYGTYESWKAVGVEDVDGRELNAFLRQVSHGTEGT
jgi:hypothetical protein